MGLHRRGFGARVRGTVYVKGIAMGKPTKKKPTKKAATALVRRNAAAIDRQETPGILGVFERLARDKRLTVEKLGALIGLQERIMAANAKSAFDAAYARMLPAIPRISKRGRILNKQKEVQSHYAKFEDIRKVVDPICQHYGFQMSYRTEWPETGVLEVVGVLTHEGGHSRESRFRTKADPSGGKNEIQGLGSGVSYGKRYTTIDLLAIVCEGQDDDGQKHGAAASRQRDEPSAQEGTAAPQTERSYANHAKAGDPITDPQRQRLFVIVRKAGRSKEEIKDWLRAAYGLDSSSKILRKDYDAICKAVEAPGVLPIPTVGQN